MNPKKPLKRVFVLEIDGTPKHTATRRERLNTTMQNADREHVATYVSVEEVREALVATASDDKTRDFVERFFLEQAWQWVQNPGTPAP